MHYLFFIRRFFFESCRCFFRLVWHIVMQQTTVWPPCWIQVSLLLQPILPLRLYVLPFLRLRCPLRPPSSSLNRTSVKRFHKPWGIRYLAFWRLCKVTHRVLRRREMPRWARRHPVLLSLTNHCLLLQAILQASPQVI